MDTIISEKQNYLESNVDNYVHHEQVIADQIREENDMNLTIIKLYKKTIKDEYDYKEKQLINNLNTNLKNATFYADNFRRMIEMCQQIQVQIIDYISSRVNPIINNIFYNLSQKNENNGKIIKRLKQKNGLNFDGIIIDSLISENKDILYTKINNEFTKAKFNLAETKSFNRTIEISWRKENVETRKVTFYPDGTTKESNWEFIRTQGKPFGRIVDYFIDPLVNSASKIKKIIFD